MMRSSAVSVWRRGAKKRSTPRSRPWTRWQKRVIMAQIIFLISIAVGIGLIFLYLAQQWQLLELSTQIAQSRSELEHVHKEIDKLEFEVSSTFTVERIRKLASEELGMVEPRIEVLTLPPLSK